MSIRKKVILSNILAFVLPIIAGILSMTMMAKVIENYNIQGDYIYLIDNINVEIKNGREDEILNDIKSIEDLGYSVDINLSDEFEYKSDKYDKELELVLGYKADLSDNMKVFNFLSETGELTKINLDGESGEENYIYVLSFYENPNYSNQLESIEEYKSLFYNSFLFVVLAIISTVILTTGFTSLLIAKSILRPLDELRDGIGKIKEGNLDFNMDYGKKDEFGLIFDDFEDMRNQLSISRQEKDKYDRNRSELIAGITHDLNTPLTSIKGYTSGLIDGIINSKEKQVKYLKNINATVDHMSSMINELFLYSTLDVDGINFNFIETNLVDFFEGLVIELEENLSQNKMSIEFETRLEKANVEIDWIHFKRAVLNIITNSGKYKKNDEGNIRILLTEADKEYLIQFEDDGRGIPKDEMKQVFAPFYRADKSRNQKTGGTGLGLAIVKGTVDAHGGSIAIDENYLDGLKLIVSLPKK